MPLIGGSDVTGTEIRAQQTATGRSALDFGDHRRLAGGKTGLESPRKFRGGGIRQPRAQLAQRQDVAALDDFFGLAAQDALENIHGIAHAGSTIRTSG